MGYPTKAEFEEARQGPDGRKWKNFNEVSRINRDRALEWHPGGLEEWSPAEWGNAAFVENDSLPRAINEACVGAMK